MSKILFINRFFFPDRSATSQILGDLCFELSKDGMEVQVITSRLLYEEAGARLLPREIVNGVTVHRAWSTSFGRRNLVGRALDYLTFYVGAAYVLWRSCDQFSTVVVKTDPPLLSVVLTPVARLRRAKVVNWLQDLFPEVACVLGVRLARGPFLRLFRFARNASLRAASTNVVLGIRMKARVEAEGVNEQAVTVIHNWADGDAIHPLSRSDNPLRTSWGLQDLFVVGYSGNFGRAHEFRTILDAVSLLAQRQDIVFLFIGGGAQQDKVREVVEARQLQNVTFRPYQPRERLRESLCAADVHLVTLNPALEGLIVPSKYYGVAAAGRPTIFVGSPDGEIPSILRESQSGSAIQVGDATELASTISNLADTPELVQQMGENARRVFMQRFNRPLAYAAWKKVLERKRTQPGDSSAEAVSVAR